MTTEIEHAESTAAKWKEAGQSHEYTMSPSLLYERCKSGICDEYHMPAGILHPKFIKAMKSTIDKHYPLLKKSSFRHDVEAGQVFVGITHAQHSFETKRALAVADLIATMEADGLIGPQPPVSEIVNDGAPDGN